MKCFILIIMMFFCFNVGYAEVNSTRDVAEKSTRVFVAAMMTIFKSQGVINSADADKSHLFGDKFIDQVRTTYKATFKTDFPKADNISIQAMLSAMTIVMEDNRPLIYDEHVKVKGFIPAIFAFQLSQRFSNAGLNLKIKYSAFKENLSNESNNPDEWEKKILNEMTSPGWKKGTPGYEEVGDQARYMFPLYHGKACLSCHGTIEENLLNQGKPKEEWTDVSIAGFKMQNFKENELGGGVSFSMDTNLAETKDPNDQLLANTTEKLTLGVYNYPPYINVNKGQPVKGALLDYLGKMAKMDNIDIVELPRKRLLRSLENESINLAFPVYDLGNYEPVGKPVTFEIPGLCFKKENFIPFLSAKHLWKDLKIVYPGGVGLVDVFANNNDLKYEITGTNLVERTIKQVELGRYDAAYVPNVKNVYKTDGKYYQTIACSSFYGDMIPIYIAKKKT